MAEGERVKLWMCHDIRVDSQGVPKQQKYLRPGQGAHFEAGAGRKCVSGLNEGVWECLAPQGSSNLEPAVKVHVKASVHTVHSHTMFTCHQHNGSWEGLVLFLIWYQTLLMARILYAQY